MTDSASLLDKQSMGGIHGEKGYKFQDAYIVSKIPHWIHDKKFIQILKEGSSDVDVAYKNGDQQLRIYTQIKDHSITPSEFRDVVREFEEKDSASPNTYQKFVLASTGLSEDVKKLKTGLNRVRGAEDYFTAQGKVTSSTLKSLNVFAKELQVEGSLNFILEKVFFEDDLPGLTRIEQIVCLFCGGMLKVKSFQDRLTTLRSVFHGIYTYIVDSSGKTISRSDLEDKMIEFADNHKLQMEEGGFTLRMYHWEDVPYELKLEYDEVLDWSKYFERKSRIIAQPEIWRKELLPELSDLQKEIRKSGSNRLIKLEGSVCLSAGIALGWAFPEVAEYVIQLQPRLGEKTDYWRTDASVQKTFNLNSTDKELHNNGKGLVVKFNIVADVTKGVDKYILESGRKFRAVLQLTPEKGIGEIISKESAVAYARSAKMHIRKAVAKYSVDKIHLFFAGPLGVAVFFGQMLNSMPEVQCYEYKQDGGYQESCLIPKK